MAKNYGSGQEPKASPAVRPWAILLSLALLALAGVAIREAWVVGSATNQSSWIQPILDYASNAPGYETWMLWAGIGSVVVGLIFLLIAVKARRKTHVQVTPVNSELATSMWLRPVDIARRSSATARQVPGVADARTAASRKRVDVTVNGDVNDDALPQRVSEAVAGVFDGLDKQPKVAVKVKPIPEVE